MKEINGIKSIIKKYKRTKPVGSIIIILRKDICEKLPSDIINVMAGNAESIEIIVTT